jgi:hypothetical protein
MKPNRELGWNDTESRAGLPNHSSRHADDVEDRTQILRLAIVHDREDVSAQIEVLVLEVR